MAHLGTLPPPVRTAGGGGGGASAGIGIIHGLLSGIQQGKARRYENTLMEELLLNAERPPGERRSIAEIAASARGERKTGIMDAISPSGSYRGPTAPILRQLLNAQMADERMATQRDEERRYREGRVEDQRGYNAALARQQGAADEYTAQQERLRKGDAARETRRQKLLDRDEERTYEEGREAWPSKVLANGQIIVRNPKTGHWQYLEVGEERTPARSESPRALENRRRAEIRRLDTIAKENAGTAKGASAKARALDLRKEEYRAMGLPEYSAEDMTDFDQVTEGLPEETRRTWADDTYNVQDVRNAMGTFVERAAARGVPNAIAARAFMGLWRQRYEAEKGDWYQTWPEPAQGEDETGEAPAAPAGAGEAAPPQAAAAPAESLEAGMAQVQAMAEEGEISAEAVADFNAILEAVREGRLPKEKLTQAIGVLTKGK